MPDLDEMRETVRETLKDAAQQISDATREAMQQLAKEAIQQIAEAAKHRLEQVGTGVSQAADGAASAAQPVAQQVQAAAQQVLASAKAAQQAAQQAQQGVAASAAQAADQVREVANTQMEEQETKSGGGFFRFLLIGLLIGAAIAWFSRGRGGDEDEDFGEENWIEVKHDETGPVAQSTPATASTGGNPATQPVPEPPAGSASDAAQATAKGKNPETQDKAAAQE